jgi:tripartite-type tricarboxylate transporter receptor subunit TctC
MALNRRTLLSATALGVLAVPNIRPAGAQTWPTRPIEFVVGFAAGGGNDVIARSLAPIMEKHIGNNARIGVVNRPGSSGEIGFTSIATARPDGYTMGMVSPAFMTIPHERRARFNFDSFDFIGNVVTEWVGVFVAPNSPFQTIQDLVDFAKANPRRINTGTPGLGTAQHRAILAMSRAAGIEVTVVPFAGAAPARTAVMGGHIDVAVMGNSDGANFVREGQLRTLGIMAPSRREELPEAPTMREQGIDVTASIDRGLATPAGVPDAIMERLSDALLASLRDPDFLARAREQALPLNPMPRAEFRAHLAQQNEEIGNLWRTNPWRQ